MSYNISKPSPFLSQYVKQYWAMESYLPIGSQHTQRIVPSGLIELMFYFGDRPKALDDEKHFSENTILSGHQKNYYDLVVSGRLSLFSITFLPFGAKFFFDIPSSEFYNQNIPLRYILKSKICELENELYNCNTFEDKVFVIEQFLVNLLLKKSKEYEKSRIINSVALINQTKGRIDIETLSSSACLSRKQYERTFANYIGSSPKQFLRTIRFQNTLQEKQKHKNIHLTDLAYSCGYYDQSHMINDFKQLAGKTPTQYFTDSEPHSDYFQ